MAVGLIPIVPSSVSFTGTSATISNNGRVDVSGLSGVTVNGVFSSAYEIYLVRAYLILDTSDPAQDIEGQFTVAGTPTASNYDIQTMDADGTSPTSARATSNSYFTFARGSFNYSNGANHHIFMPAETQETILFSEVTNYGSSIRTAQYAQRQTDSTAFDGFYVTCATDPFTGWISVFGYED